MFVTIVYSVGGQFPQHGRGMIMFDQDRPLPFLFDTADEAGDFLDTVERTGLNLFPDMCRKELANYINLWRDVYKRV